MRYKFYIGSLIFTYICIYMIAKALQSLRILMPDDWGVG